MTDSPSDTRLLAAPFKALVSELLLCAESDNSVVFPFHLISACSAAGRSMRQYSRAIATQDVNGESSLRGMSNAACWASGKPRAGGPPNPGLRC